MTIDAISGLGPVKNILASGQYPNVDLGVGPMPGLKTGGGMQVAEGSLWIVNRSRPEQQAAAWEYVKFLVDTPQLAKLDVETGYVPFRTSVVESPEIKDLWAKEPEYKVGYDQVFNGPTNDSTAGALVGPYNQIRKIVKEGIASMLTGKATPDAALLETQRRSDALIADYNSRLAG
jgi:sn-glycerol 3-phosphate transport system substrate-binding protein